MINIAHVSLTVSDLGKARSFYTRLLGFRPEDWHEGSLLNICTLSANGFTLELLEFPEGPTTDRPAGLDHMAFYCPDLNSLIALFKNAGLIDADPEIRHSPSGRPFFFISGPDGERLEFLEYKKDSLQPLADLYVERLAIFEERWHAAGSDLTADRIHDLRVATRRLSAVFKHCLVLQPFPAVNNIEGSLKNTFRTMGRLRDAQVEIAGLHRENQGFPGLLPLQEYLATQEKHLLTQTAEGMENFDFPAYRQCMSDYADFLNKSLGLYDSAFIEQTLADSHQTFRKQVKKLARKANPNHLAGMHRLRIAVKRLRYSSEALQDILALPAENVELLKNLQDITGKVQDTVALIQKLPLVEGLSSRELTKAQNLLMERQARYAKEVMSFLKSPALQNVINSPSQPQKEG